MARSYRDALKAMGAHHLADAHHDPRGKRGHVGALRPTRGDHVLDHVGNHRRVAGQVSQQNERVTRSWRAIRNAQHAGNSHHADYTSVVDGCRRVMHKMTAAWIRCRADPSTVDLVTLVVGFRARRVRESLYRLVPCVTGLSKSTIEDLAVMARLELDRAVATGMIHSWCEVRLLSGNHARDNDNENARCIAQSADHVLETPHELDVALGW